MKRYLRRMPIAADFYRLLRLTFHLMSLPRRSLLGFKLVGGHPLQLRGQYEPEVANLLRQRLPNAKRFINVGANIGYWPVIIRHFGFVGEMILIEPDSINLKILRRNLKINNLQGIKILDYAANNVAESLKLYGYGTGISGIKGWAGGFSDRACIVKSNLLDALVNSSSELTIFLIDVEGFELQVLEGAVNHINGNSEFLIEIAINEHQPSGIQMNPSFARIFELMTSNNYKVFSWVPSFCELQISDIAHLMSGELENKSQMYYFSK